MVLKTALKAITIPILYMEAETDHLSTALQILGKTHGGVGRWQTLRPQAQRFSYLKNMMLTPKDLEKIHQMHLCTFFSSENQFGETLPPER